MEEVFKFGRVKSDTVDISLYYAYTIQGIFRLTRGGQSVIFCTFLFTISLIERSQNDALKVGPLGASFIFYAIRGCKVQAFGTWPTGTGIGLYSGSLQESVG